MTRSVYQLKVTIQGISPPVWRRVVVPADLTLARLHDVLQAAFGWEDCHLHEFEINGVRYGEDDGERWRPPKDERRAKLSLVARPGATFHYSYDFGDDWRHKIVVEKTLPAVPGVCYPTCTGGRRACPPEDCGGPWGYQHFLAAIGDPSHAEHDRMLEWVGGSFDPDALYQGDFEHGLEPGRLAAL